MQLTLHERPALDRRPSSQQRQTRAPLRIARHAAVLGAIFSASSAHAYVASTTTSSGKPLRWTESNCVMLTPHSKGSADIGDGSELAAIQRAVQSWHASTGSCTYLRFDLLAAAETVKVEFLKGGDNQNVITWVESGWRERKGHDAQAAGLTTVFFVDSPGSPRDGKILDADVELNGEFFEFSAKPSGVAGKTDVENTVVHELGHVLGLDHPCDDGTRSPAPTDHTGATIPKCSARLSQEMRDVTMFNFADPGETKKRSPEADDVLGVCSTYPQSADPGVCAPPDTGARDPGCTIARGDQAPLALLVWLLLGPLLAARRRRRA